jgi:murein L,D-transpeptidase YafK
MVNKKNKNISFNAATLKNYLNKTTIRNVIIFSGGIIVFLAGVVVYGVILNLREVSLSEAMQERGINVIDDPVLIINRSTYTINLYEDTLFIKSYRASFGKNVSLPKTKANDYATPVGEYAICSIDTSNVYYKFLRLNYPNLIDDAEGLRKGLINQKEYDELRFEYYYAECPTLKTALGGNIGIHGIGRMNYIFKNLPFVFNWTDGSIAVSNEDIDEIYSIVKKGTKIVIK